MITKDEISRFYDEVAKLDLKFPVAYLSKMTGESKANVSKILNKKMDPSESFIKRVYDSFKIVSRGINLEEVEVKAVHEPFSKALLEEKEARRRETEETLKIERERNDKLMALIEKHMVILQASSNKIDDQQGMILSVIRSDNTVMLENFDLLLKHPKGTSATKSGNIQLAADSLKSNKGKLEGTGKKSK